MMISMNVPQYLWGQTILTTAYLINRMPSRVLDWKSPMEMLKGKNENILPLKTFGYVCFVQDNRPNVEKLNLRVVKCIFVGYSRTHKGYVCWSPVEKRLFMNMNVTFRKLEQYYSSEAISPFGDSLDTRGMRREGESNSDGERRIVNVGGVGCPIRKDSVVVEPKKEDLTMVEPEKENSTVVEMEVERNEPEASRTQAQGESRYGEVYVRRKKQNEEVVSTVSLVPSLLPLPISTLKTPIPSISNSEYTSDIIFLSTPPIPLRRTSRENAGVPPDRYGFPHDIVKFIYYSHISPIYRAFITSLDTVFIPKCWQVAKRDPK
jgi:hypothetical protein